MNHVVILSDDGLFAEALASSVQRELQVQVTTLESAESLGSLRADLVISTLPSLRMEGRILYYMPGQPRKITAILTDIAQQLAERHLLLSDIIMLQEKNHKLERIDTGTVQDLTEKEQALLLYIKEEGEARREDILKNVWGFAEGVNTATLDTHLYRLRQKWRELADYDCIIATDKGYRWYE